MSAPEPAPQMIIAGRFRVERLLGRGGMGSVWLCTHLGLEVPVAVKFMKAGASAEARVRFHREAKAAAQIRSSNVVQILDYGIEDDRPYIAMELLSGEDLRARLKRVGRLSLVEAYAILVPVARGLARAHEARLVHRDLKPENIFLTREGDAEIPKILDFGVAKALRPQGAATEDAATLEGAVLGTPYYMSPEQARGRLDVDHRSDLWSLGVILYQLLTGKRPFPSKDLGELILQISADPIPPVSSLAPHLPPGADAFFERALARDPEERFPSAREMTMAFSEMAAPSAEAPPWSSPDLRPSLPPPTPPLVTPPPPETDATTVRLDAGARPPPPPPSTPSASGRWQPVPGVVIDGKLRLDRQIGAGGMGSIWSAWNLQLRIPVAVKIMADGTAEQRGDVDRFEREARAAAQIRSPHVVTIYEHGVHEGRPYMVMDLLEGEDLLQRLRREGRLPLPATARIVRDIARALLRAHELGIVHRDLKPANVFLAREGDEEVVRVLDFGVAKLTHGGDGGVVTGTGEMIGTPTYMSPEQIRASKSVDARADLWSLGVIAFRTLTGRLPYSGEIFELTSQILYGPVPVASAALPELSPAVDAFFARALARDIHQRFQGAREMSDAFDALLGDAPAPPVSAPQRAPQPEAASPSSPPGGAVAARPRGRVVAALVALALVAVAAALWVVLHLRR